MHPVEAVPPVVVPKTRTTVTTATAAMMMTIRCRGFSSFLRCAPRFFRPGRIETHRPCPILCRPPLRFCWLACCSLLALAVCVGFSPSQSGFTFAAIVVVIPNTAASSMIAAATPMMMMTIHHHTHTSTPEKEGKLCMA